MHALFSKIKAIFRKKARGEDLGPVLRSWPYDPSLVSARRVRGADGRQKIQIRLDLGILQMEVSGRPDGQRPFGKDSLLEYYQQKAAQFQRDFGDDGIFRLSHSECVALQREALQYYHRFVALFYLKDFEGVIRDTTRNLRAVDFVKKYAMDEKDVWNFEQFWPYLTMMQVRARASLLMARQNFKKAEEIVELSVARVERFYLEHDQPEFLESSMVLTFLKKWAEEIRQARPLSPMEKLQRELDEAVAHEDFERAAELRDRIQEIQNLEKKEFS